MRKAYQSDLSDAEWSCLQSYLPAPKANGRPRVYTLREILDAIFFYVLKSGCPWRLLPHDLERLGRPSITTSDDSAWMVAGRGFTAPCASGSGFASRERSPTQRGHIVDSQSVKTTGVGAEQRGYDGAKKIKGRKRHLLVDTQGLVLEVRLHSAEIQDRREGIKLLLEPSSPDRLPRLWHVWLDAGYTGEDKGAGWVRKVLGWSAQIVRDPPKIAPEGVMRAWVREFNNEGIAIDLDKLMAEKGPSRPFLPKRWIVERTFSLGSLRTGG